jgi:hypothetical protein
MVGRPGSSTVSRHLRTVFPGDWRWEAQGVKREKLDSMTSDEEKSWGSAAESKLQLAPAANLPVLRGGKREF